MAATTMPREIGRTRRRVWPAADARRLALRWFEQGLTGQGPDEEVPCAWCHRPLAETGVQRGHQPYCSVDCAEAIHIAGLYLG